MSDGRVPGEEMIDTADRSEDERGGQDGGVCVCVEGGALSHSVTNDGGRSKPFHS